MSHATALKAFVDDDSMKTKLKKKSDKIQPLTLKEQMMLRSFIQYLDAGMTVMDAKIKARIYYHQYRKDLSEAMLEAVKEISTEYRIAKHLT